MMQIPDAKAIMVQPMLKGTELFIGAKYEEVRTRGALRFGRYLCGGIERCIFRSGTSFL